MNALSSGCSSTGKTGSCLFSAIILSVRLDGWLVCPTQLRTGECRLYIPLPYGYGMYIFIDPFHVRHSIAVTVVIYHTTYEPCIAHPGCKYMVVIIYILIHPCILGNSHGISIYIEYLDVIINHACARACDLVHFCDRVEAVGILTSCIHHID